MSIEKRNTVDFLVFERDEPRLVLVISDHLDWVSPMDHLSALQEKMNGYAGFIANGQVWESASEKSGRKIPKGSVPLEIRVSLKHSPPPLFFEFMGRAKEAFATLGVSVGHELKPG